MSAEEKGGNADPTENGGNEVAEKSFSASDVERIVKERLTREQKKFDKQINELQAAKKPSGSANIEEDLRGRLSQYETQTKSLVEKLNTYRGHQLKSTVEAECAKHGCNDPELLATHFLSRNLVRLEDDDSIVAENASNSLADLVKDELAKRPHLVKPSQVSGMGSKATGTARMLGSSGKSPKDMTPEEYAAWKEGQGIKGPGFKLFG